MLRTVLISAAAASSLLLSSGTALAAPGDASTTGAADQITDTSARVVVYVVEVANACYVDYGTTLAYGSTQKLDCGGTTRTTLTGLTPGTTYYYRLRVSTDSGDGHSPTYKSFT